MLPCGLDLQGLPALQRVCLYGLNLAHGAPVQVQQLAVAIAGWPVKVQGGELKLETYDFSSGSDYAWEVGGAFASVLALSCPQMQSAAWPKQVNSMKVLIGAMLFFDVAEN